MWNLVQIASKWYHVDVTWDDSVSKRNKRDIFGVALHKNFLLSNTGIEKEGHYGFSSPSAKKKTYDKAFWRGVETAFWKQGNRLLYGTASGIYARNLALQSAVRIQKGKVECLVHFKQDKYFFISGQSIYLFDVSSGSLSKKYTAKSGQYLMQLKCSGKKLSFRYDQRGKLYTVQKNLAEDGTFLT